MPIKNMGVNPDYKSWLFRFKVLQWADPPPK
jgi:hypothetical protein